MTTITIYKNSNQEYKGFVCIGHADYAKKFLFKKQPDILCASISVLVINTINSMDEITGEKENMSVDTNEETGFIKCTFNEPANEKSALLLDAMVFGLTNISKSYGEQYLQVKFEEV